MRKMSGTSRRSKSVWSLSGSLVVLLVVVAVGGGGEETTVPDELIRDIVAMPEGTLAWMQEFVQTADELLESDPAARSAMVADPDLWFEETHGVLFEDAVLWAVDLSVSSEEDAAWLFVSEYLGDGELLDVGIGLTGPELTLFIQAATDPAASSGPPDAITQRVLGVIGSRPDAEWNALRAIVLDANLPGESERKTLLKGETRQALINQGQRLSSQSTRLIVVDHAAGDAAEAVHMPELPFGMIRTPQAITVFGESVLLVYNSLF